MKDILMVIGPHKCGTSSIASMLNRHPKICVGFESFVIGRPRPLGKDLCELLEKDFSYFEDKNFFLTMLNLKSFIDDNWTKYKYYGDKWPISVTSGDNGRILMPHETVDKIFNDFGEAKIIFPIRDIKEWLVHNKIREWCKTDNDMTAPAIGYLNTFLTALAHDNVLVIKLDDFVYHNDATIKRIAEFIDVDERYFDKWWSYKEKEEKEDEDKYEEYGDDIIKRTVCVSGKGRGVAIKPKIIDMRFKYYRVDDIEEIFSIFYKYYNGDEEYNKDDALKVKELVTSQIKIEDAFTNIRKNDIYGK